MSRRVWKGVQNFTWEWIMLGQAVSLAQFVHHRTPQPTVIVAAKYCGEQAYEMNKEMNYGQQGAHRQKAWKQQIQRHELTHTNQFFNWGFSKPVARKRSA
jgi:hypothetical protein